MAEHLGAKYNSVKAAYAKLSDEGLLMRRGRGSYSPNVPGILLHLMDRVEALEKGSK
jgi:DNA-binding transcriptional regulator YhcF (GntR family)